jgi:hypothetical protein
MTGWRGDERACGIWGGAVATWVGAAAVIVAVPALSVSKQLFAAVAIGISAAVIIVLTVIIIAVRKSIRNRRDRRYLDEERTIIVNINGALEKVGQDLEALPEHTDSFDADMQAVNNLVAQIKATPGIHPFAVSVADYVDNHTFQSQEPETSLRSVIGAKKACDKALAGYAHLERGLESRGWWPKRHVRHTTPQPETTPATTRKLGTGATHKVWLPRGEHGSIADTEDLQVVGSPAPATARSPRAEGEPDMSVISTLPSAAEYQATLTRLFSELSDLNDVPAFPQYIAAGAILDWQIRTGNWLRKAKKILEDATNLASQRESQPYPSVELSQAEGDAEDGLLWIRDFVDHKGQSIDGDQFPERCEKTIAAISNIVAYAAGLRE